MRKRYTIIDLELLGAEPPRDGKWFYFKASARRKARKMNTRIRNHRYKVAERVDLQ